MKKLKCHTLKFKIFYGISNKFSIKTIWSCDKKLFLLNGKGYKNTRCRNYSGGYLNMQIEMPRTTSADENQVSARSLTTVNDSVSESAVQKHHWAEQDLLLLVTVARNHYIYIYIYMYTSVMSACV